MCLWLVAFTAASLVAVLAVFRLMDKSYLDTGGRYVLITGCDSGFGRLLASGLAGRRACRVIAACLTAEGAESLRASTAAPPDSLIPIILDVTSTESILQARDKVAQIVAGKGLWGLVNNAGVTGIPVPYHWIRRAETQRILDVNLMGTVQTTNVFFPLVRRARGRVVNVSSATAVVPIPAGGYSMSKMGVEAFSDVLRLSAKPFGVSVHILEPGYFKTNVTSIEAITGKVKEIWDRLPQCERDMYGQEWLDTYVQNIVEHLELSSPHLNLVTEAMEHALRARWPWRRYLPGYDIKFFYKPVSMLPAWLADIILGRLFSLPQPAGLSRPEVDTFAADN